MAKKDTKGITVKKSDNFSEWYTQVIQKADLADYTSVSGCIAYKPGSYEIWEKIKNVTDVKFKQIGIKNCYFPIFIPESLLQKEADHIEHFSPEVAWVTHAGDTKLGERLAIRPTSETIMYESYSKWIRSHNDLPLRLNQWNNVVRWEFKHATPFLRSREFLWNEGHTCFATQKEAEAEQKDILAIYDTVCRDLLALPSLIGRKSEKEKFAGALYTDSLEFVMPNGKAIQGPDFHHDGQNFAKVFDITFTDKNGKKEYVWQNTFAITTRMIGVLIGIHGDDKGLVLPPSLASTQVVIVPILFDDSRAKVLKEVENVKKKLEKKGFSVYVDDREGYSPGWKFNEWEVKGIPLRIEIGPKDVANKKVMVARRDTGEKKAVSTSTVEKEVDTLLQNMQKSMLQKAETILKTSIVEVKTMKEAEKQIQNKKIVFAPWCSTKECEEQFKDKTGAKSLNSPFKQPSISGKCFACKEKATTWFYFGKSY
ncbi:proline--tRNA ligase [Candidatus Woesearchaeota archaeon]|jgi:prolyl-tRNA synthetase|nr:proline--tRNA ligase [Candidatus Woesearchaeota archaeon]MBT5397516.1 proline--tRNA ligase [Candidatus Woesearchaeota archaeon]MBT5924945.1 proline--tRNA ligase [Candidatus Woesearchaeota archaeon]MBT6367911.1 proline--tRNA ligase [Candidatus Woesearchaeota archaeon]MBT7763135.1 proline--tRNA ligase [Candidatus Woesearchaeota archaeon]